MIGEMLFLSI